MKPLTTVILVACSVAAQNTLWGQTPGAVQQVESIRLREQNEAAVKSFREGDTVPEIAPDESSDVGPQSVLKIKQRKTYFEAMADAQYFYTDNMFLGDDFEKSADVLVSTVQFAFAPTPYDLLDGKFAPRLGYRHQWFDYGLIDDDKVTVLNLNDLNSGLGAIQEVRLNEFDFNAQTIFADAQWSRGQWMAWMGFDFTRLMSTSDYAQFYREYVPRWGLQHVFSINGNAALTLGYSGDYRFTSTDVPPTVLDDDANDRTDHSLFAAWTQMLCPHSLVQPYYRFTYTHFTAHSSRDDALHSLGLGLYFYITPQISIRTFVAYDIRQSDGAQDYEKLDAGGGLNLTLRF